MTAVGLVLGAGGVVGGAWHAGTLHALRAAGWDARSAGLIVGTSAGSVTGAMLRMGIDPSDLFAGATEQPLSAHAQGLYAKAGGQPISVPSFRGARVRGLPAAPFAGLRSLMNGMAPRPVAALTAWLPDGTVDAGFIGERIDAIYDGTPWPADPFWACAVRRDDNQLVVFGRDVLDASVGTAVQASSSIPSFFTPVVHAGVRYVDGGVHSPTNADLLLDLGFEAVVISSPMSGTGAALRRPALSARPFHTRRLAEEVKLLRAAGIEVLVLQPDPTVVAAMGIQAMDVARRPTVARAAYESVSTHLTDHPFLTHLR
jgi:NTE family protein